MSAPLVFMDTETTGLALTDDIWEFAAVRREPDGSETEWHMFIEHDRGKCADLPPSFRDDHYSRYLDHLAYTPKQAASLIGDIFRNGKPHVVGAVPQFDTERIALMHAREWPAAPALGWHYHLIDVENLAVGYLRAQVAVLRARGEDLTKAAQEFIAACTPPWDSDAISAALGIAPDQFARHTAMGDVRWAMAIYDAVMNGGAR